MKADVNNEIRKALVSWGFKKADKDRYEFSQADKKMVWTGVRDYHFEDCIRRYTVTFENWWGDETPTTRVDEDGKDIEMFRFQPCPWGWREVEAQVGQMHTALRNKGCKIQ